MAFKILEHVDGTAGISVQGNGIRIDPDGSRIAGEAQCCICPAFPVANNVGIRYEDGRRAWCAMHAAVSGMQFYSGCLEYAFATGGNVDGVTGDVDGVYIAVLKDGGIQGPCSQDGFDLRHFSHGSNNGCPQAIDSLNRSTGPAPTIAGADTNSSCEWYSYGVQGPNGGDGGTFRHMKYGTGCTEQLVNQKTVVSLDISYRCGYWVAQGYLWANARQHFYMPTGGPIEKEGGSIAIRWMYGYVAASTRQLYNSTLFIPNLQTITNLGTAPRNALGNLTVPLCFTQGGGITLSMQARFLPTPCETIPVSSSSSIESSSSSTPPVFITKIRLTFSAGATPSGWYSAQVFFNVGVKIIGTISPGWLRIVDPVSGVGYVSEYGVSSVSGTIVLAFYDPINTANIPTFGIQHWHRYPSASVGTAWEVLFSPTNLSTLSGTPVTVSITSGVVAT